MAIKIKVGVDAEFITYHKNVPIYPSLRDHKDAYKLERFRCDEFGHCVEARPKEAESGRDLVLNIMMI